MPEKQAVKKDVVIMASNKNESVRVYIKIKCSEQKQRKIEKISFLKKILEEMGFIKVKEEKWRHLGIQLIGEIKREETRGSKKDWTTCDMDPIYTCKTSIIISEWNSKREYINIQEERNRENNRGEILVFLPKITTEELQTIKPLLEGIRGKIIKTLIYSEHSNSPSWISNNNIDIADRKEMDKEIIDKTISILKDIRIEEIRKEL